MTWAEARITADPRGLDVGDYAFISSRALRGYPPAAIAKMIGRPLETVQEAMFMAPEREVRMPVLKLAAPVVEVVPSPPGIPDRARKVLDEIAARYDLTRGDLLGRRRRLSHTIPRQHAMHDMMVLRIYSVIRLGMIFQRDHSTVLFGYRAHRRRLADSDSRLRL